MSGLNVRVEELSSVVRRLEVRVPAERVTEVTELMYLRLGQQARIPGYRQGRVPRNVLTKHYGDRIGADVARDIVATTLDEAIEEMKLHPVSQPTVEPGQLKKGEEFRYTARLEVKPDVKLVQYRDLEVSFEEFRVSDAEVDARLEQMREAAERLEPVEGRDVLQVGDVGSVSYTVLIEGSSKADVREDALVRCEPGLFVAGQGEKLTGQKIGEVREFTELFPEEAGPKLVGKKAEIKVTLKGLKSRVRPALDDEFAKDQGADSLEALKAQARQELQERAEERNSEKRSDALKEVVVAKNPVEAPPALVDSAAGQMAVNSIMTLIRRGLPINPDDRLLAAMKEDMRPRALIEVKASLVFDAIARAENVEITAADVTARIEQIAKEQGVTVEKVRAEYPNPQSLGSLAGNLRLERARSIVEASAKFVAKEAPAETAG